MIIVMISVAVAFLLNLVFISPEAMSNPGQISSARARLQSEILEVDRAISSIGAQIQLLSAEQRKLYVARESMEAQLNSLR